MEKDPYSIILRPCLTEKAQKDTELRNTYHFEVAPKANKIEIKRAIEQIYSSKGVKVKKVRIINKAPKKRRFRFRIGFTTARKNAIVVLDKEQKLELF